MGDLRDDLIRLAEEWEIESDRRTRAGDYGDEAMAMCAARIRSLLASHPAPSPSVSRDAETKAIDAARRLDAACRKHEEHGDNFPAYWIREEIDALRATLDAPSPSVSRDADVYDTAAAEVAAELRRARAKHAPMRGAHEGYAVLLEEVDELWDEVKRRDHDLAAMRKEAVQVAAMGLAFAIEVCHPAPSPRSEAGGGPCCVDRARRGWCDCARAPVPAESATEGEEDGR